MCKSSNKALKAAIAEQNRQAELARQDAARAQDEQRKIQEQAVALQQQQLAFQQQQAEYQKAYDAKVEAIANRPPPPSPASSGTVVTGGSDGMAATDNSQDAVDSRKKGRRSLRIDLNSPQTAGSTGLNIPVG